MGVSNHHWIADVLANFWYTRSKMTSSRQAELYAKPQPQLHVIFGTGPLGKWTAHELLQMGHRVRMINRSGQANDMPTGAEIQKGDAYDAQKNIEMTQGANAIYFCAQPEYHQWEGNFPRLQSAILQAAIANQTKLIAAENLYMYGNTHGKKISEDMPYNAHTKKGRIRQAMTQSLFAAHQTGQARVASVRGSDFFGPNDRIYGDNIFAPALAGKSINAIGSLDQPHTFTYTVDFGKALALAGTNEAALGQVWHVPSNPAITQRVLIKMIAEEIQKPIKTILATPLIVWALGLFNPSLREMNEMLYQFTQPFELNSNKMTQAFGLQATPTKQQIRETVTWVLAQPSKKH
jgi:nucleoside-diphosphate-sugar epimerase